MASSGREKALETTLSQIQKRFGEGALMRMGDASTLQVESISTGCISLDIALGLGGIPKGRVTERYGPEASGKTTLCQHIVAESQKVGGVCAFIDMEHALDPSYAAKVGVDIENMYISQPDTGEQALEIADSLVRSGAIDVIVVDSVAALVPRAALEGDMGDATMGNQARLMSQALRKLSGAIKQSNTAMVFTNQLRQKIGVMFGNPETTTGGQALKYYSSVRLDVRRLQAIKSGQQIVGNRVRVRVTKNKVAPPFRQRELDIMYDQGISKAGDLLDLGVEHEVIDKRGAFYSFDDTRLGQGRENAKQYLSDNMDMAVEIEKSVRAIAAPENVTNGNDDSESESESVDSSNE